VHLRRVLRSAPRSDRQAARDQLRDRLGAPTDIALYQSEASTSPDGRVQLAAGQTVRFFGTTPEQIAPWNPVSVAASNHPDVLLLHEADDAIVSAQHALRYRDASPTTQVVELEPGGPDDPTTDFVHGTVSTLGRAHYPGSTGPRNSVC